MSSSIEMSLYNRESPVKPTLEIERKYLVTSVPEGFEHYPCQLFEQGYTPAGIRLRKAVGTDGIFYTRTTKEGRGMVRVEKEEIIDEEIFSQEWLLTQDRQLKKLRFFIPDKSGNKIHLDVYVEGLQLAGKVVAEVEFTSKKKGQAYNPPYWFGKEVTGKKIYSNKTLASQGWPKKNGAIVIPLSSSLMEIVSHLSSFA